jgi:hypothetical protein
MTGKGREATRTRLNDNVMMIRKLVSQTRIEDRVMRSWNPENVRSSSTTHVRETTPVERSCMLWNVSIQDLPQHLGELELGLLAVHAVS